MLVSTTIFNITTADNFFIRNEWKTIIRHLPQMKEPIYDKHQRNQERNLDSKLKPKDATLNYRLQVQSHICLLSILWPILRIISRLNYCNLSMRPWNIFYDVRNHHRKIFISTNPTTDSHNNSYFKFVPDWMAIKHYETTEIFLKKISCSPRIDGLELFDQVLVWFRPEPALECVLWLVARSKEPS